MIKARDSYGTQTHRPEESASELNDLFLFPFSPFNSKEIVQD